MLQKIVNKTLKRVDQAKKKIPLTKIKQAACNLDTDTGFPFLKALKTPKISFICEIKKASPSKGIISEKFPYIKIAKQYEEAGASAISVLTEPEFFMGKNNYLTQIKKNVQLPLLRKDFIVDEYMIYESKILGADAILLICSILKPEVLKHYINISNMLGMSALVEVHDEAQIIMAIKAGADIIGVNNRDLTTFLVDIKNTIRLRKLIPQDLIFVSESGITQRSHIEKLENHGVDAVLIGEALMKSDNIAQKLAQLRGGRHE